MTKLQGIFLLIIIFLGVLFRLYRFNGPVADWHSWRQADTSAVSKIFVKNGFDILHPKYFDISNIQTGKNNPEGYRFVEFPLYNIFQGLFYKVIGIFTVEEWGRIVSISSSMLAGLFLYLLTKKYFDKRVAFFSLIFYTFLPFSVYYGRTILPDTAMVMASLGGIYFFDRWIEKKFSIFNFQFLVALLFTASAFLLKPYAVFFTLPMVYIAWKKFGLKFILDFRIWVFLILSISPLVWWRIWMLQFPEGIPANIWLLNGNGIRFRPAFFRWIFYERITKLISGYFGVIFLVTGIFSFKKQKNISLFFCFSFSSLFYLFVVATGNVQHDYYQILIIPTLSMLYALGANYIWQKGNIAKIVLFVISIAAFLVSLQQVKDYFNINNRALVLAGKKADAILPKNAMVIAPYNGDTTFLYYINRKGWPAFQASVEDLQKLGATHMVLVSPTENDKNGFGKKYEVMATSKDYLILKLK